MVVRPLATFCAPFSRNGRMPSAMAWRRNLPMSQSALISFFTAGVSAIISYTPTRPR